MNRVAITGLGAVCGLGQNLKDVWSNALAGKPGISLIEILDTEPLPVKIAGEVKNFQLSGDILPEKEHSRYDRFIHLAVHAAHEAIAHAGLVGDASYERERMGTILGVGIGGFPFIESSADTFREKGTRRISPFFIPSVIPNMAPGLISILNDLKGINYSISSACASAAHGIAAAMMEIQRGTHDVMITGGAESALTNLSISGFANMKALSKWNDRPAEASRPFDTERNGFVMGEGAGILVLENLEKAKARGATIYAEVVGQGSSSDAYHITAPEPEGEGASRCMKAALNDADLSGEEIGYINAHGTSTPLGDLGETKAIKRTFGKHAKKLAVSSTKSMTGHLLGAAGGIESVFCTLALHEQILPPTINLDNQDPECDLDYVANQNRKATFEYALNNSFGFGGTNCSTIFKRYQG